jgi:hypothetical protein
LTQRTSPQWQWCELLEPSPDKRDHNWWKPFEKYEDTENCSIVIKNMNPYSRKPMKSLLECHCLWYLGYNWLPDSMAACWTHCDGSPSLGSSELGLSVTQHLVEGYFLILQLIIWHLYNLKSKCDNCIIRKQKKYIIAFLNMDTKLFDKKLAKKYIMTKCVSYLNTN